MDKNTQKWVIATAINGDDGESYLFELTKVESPSSGTNYTEFKDLGTGVTHIIDAGESKDFGLVRITMNTVDETSKVINFDVSAISGTAYTDRLVTKEGMTIVLPVSNSSIPISAQTNTNQINLNATSATPHFNMTVTEEQASTGNIGSGSSFTARLGYESSDNKATVTSISGVTRFETEDSSNKFLHYVESDMATKILTSEGGDQDNAVVTYAGDESYAEVFIASEDTSVSIPDSGDDEEDDTPTTTVQELGDIALTDEQAGSSTKNLIVIGGSCVNSLTATLLGVSYPSCGSAWQTATNVGSGEFLVQTFERSGGKIATVIAGYNAGDTKSGVTKITTDPTEFDLTAGKAFKGTQAGVVDVSVTETAAAEEPAAEEPEA
jgi:hypothetical protein